MQIFVWHSKYLSHRSGNIVKELNFFGIENKYGYNHISIKLSIQIGKNGNMI